MVKKILKYGIGIIIIVILLMLALVFKPSSNDKNNNNVEENKTIEEQVQETLSLDLNDENIIGYITIKDLGIDKAPIADGTDIKTIGKYVGHFENTSYLEGNVCLCSHNRGSKAAFFENLKNSKNGMEIEYITKYETKKYKITEIKKIEETDLTVLNPTEDNRITLITCVENQRNLRLCVTGVEKGE